MLSDLRKYPRYFLPSGLPAVLEKAQASVVDLSEKGARIQITQQLTIGAHLPFALSTPKGPIEANATVLWCQIAALALDDEQNDVYLAGLTFDEAKPEIGAVLDQLIAAEKAIAISDARSTERYSVTTMLHGSIGDACEDARILDLSIRGARISAKTHLRTGTETSLRFRLTPGPAVDIRATVIWCRQSDRKIGYEVGLNIEGEEALLRAVIAQLCMRKHARVDLNSLRRKFDPMGSKGRSGVLALAS
jgi:hypothetical protein